MTKEQKQRNLTETDCMTYTIPEVSRLLGVNVITVYGLAKREDFPAVRIGKRIVVPKEAFKRWLER